MCVFRHLYLLDDIEVLNGVKTEQFRYDLGYRMGTLLNKADLKDIDFVAAVPNTGLPYARGMAQAIGKPHKDILRKKTHSRSLCLESSDVRAQFLLNAFAVDENEVEGKSVLLVDEAIFTGATLKTVCAMLREAHVSEIKIAIPSPKSNCNCPAHVLRNLKSIYDSCSCEVLAHALGVQSITHIQEEEFQCFLSEKDIDVCTQCFSEKYANRNGKSVLQKGDLT